MFVYIVGIFFVKTVCKFWCGSDSISPSTKVHMASRTIQDNIFSWPNIGHACMWWQYVI